MPININKIEFYIINVKKGVILGREIITIIITGYNINILSVSYYQALAIFLTAYMVTYDLFTGDKYLL